MKLSDFGLARMYGTPKVRLSPQAITLWYKPPELLLGASEYSSAADMWSVGCIFAELLLRRPFLQGNQTDLNQLNTLFRVLGTPSDENWPDHKALPLPSRGLLWDDCPPIPFHEIFTAAPKDAISLLRSMLGRLNCCRSFHIFGRFKLIYFSFYFAVLDPNKRFSASQCLIHPYFTNDPSPTSNENLLLDAPTN
jgi:cyclin-dependent kinase 7